MKKQTNVWYDVETSGLEVKAGACILQFACIIERDGEVLDTVDFKINPKTYGRTVTIDPEAVKINKLTDYDNYEDADYVIAYLMDKLTKHCPDHKATLIGYNNSTFDKYFIEDWFKTQNKDFNTYFKYKQIDVFELVKALQHMKLLPKTFNQKLETVAEALGVEVEGDWHDALTDVLATEQIYIIIKDKLCLKN
jgi:DNA polymerase III epsilon subunit-like protein